MILKKYYHIGKINFLNSFVYVGDVLASSLFVGMIIFVFTQLWQAIYTSGQIIEGFSIVMMLWYLVMTESIVTSLPQVVEDIGEEIQTGEIANYLNKPYNYLVYKYSKSLGSAIFKFCLTFIIGGIIVSLVIGKFTFDIKTVPFILLAILLAITLHFVLMAFLGVFAFWFEDSRSLYLIYQKIVFVIGGMLLPLELFPDWLGFISKILPFSYIAYYPAKLFVMFSNSLFVKVIGFQLLWIVIFSLLTLLIYKIGERRISINGG